MGILDIFSYSVIIVLCTNLVVCYKTYPDLIIGKYSETLTDDNWTAILKGDWMIEFKAPWCPACQTFTATWESLARWSDEYGMTVADVDVTTNPTLSGRFFVTSLPTIYHVHDGVFRQYEGSRAESDLIEFVSEKRWKELEPVAWWRTPTQPQMAMVGYVFKLSLLVRSFYDWMVHYHGIPEWACYVMIAVAVIITGLLVGLALVVLCDYAFPARPAPPPPARRPEADRNDNDSDIVDDTRSGDGDVAPGLRKRQVDTSNTSDTQ